MQFAVTHDGKGIAKEEYANLLMKKGAIGLKNIENRLRFTNAVIEFRKLSEHEFSTLVLVPIINKI